MKTSDYPEQTVTILWLNVKRKYELLSKITFLMYNTNSRLLDYIVKGKMNTYCLARELKVNTASFCTGSQQSRSKVTVSLWILIVTIFLYKIKHQN